MSTDLGTEKRNWREAASRLRAALRHEHAANRVLWDVLTGKLDTADKLIEKLGAALDADPCDMSEEFCHVSQFFCPACKQRAAALALYDDWKKGQPEGDDE